MGYINEIRNKIGHAPFIICACGCLIFNDKGQVLLQKRKDNNQWGNPGGIMELGETVYETVKREAKEETNLEVNDLELFNIYSGKTQHYIYPNGDEAYFVNIIFKTENYDGSMKSDDESIMLKFFDIDKIPNNITPTFSDVLKDLKLD